MSKIKKPKWDRQHSHASSGSYGTDTIMGHIDVGMTATVQYKSIDVLIKISKVINGHDIEGAISNIFTETKTIDDLAVGDYVFADYWAIKHHS